MKLAKKTIQNKLMPSSLEREFKRNGFNSLLESVYQQTAELIKDNQSVNKSIIKHLE